MTNALTKSQVTAADVSALLRARNPLLWVVTREEARVERYLFEAAAAASYATRTWDVAQGVANLGGNLESIGSPDPAVMLDTIRDRASNSGERCVWIMRDLDAWLSGPSGASTLRQIRNLVRTLPATPRDRAQALVILTTSSNVPPELAGAATVIEWPNPDRAEIAAILDAAIAALPEDLKASAAPNGKRDAAIDAAVGLTSDEAASCYAKSLVQLRRIDPATVAVEKKRIVTREKVLEWFDPLPGGLDAVGGLDVLKTWLLSRATAYTPAARAYGLPAPKGAFLVGVPGCGKSLVAKAIATSFGVPLLRIDFGALKSKFVGESEGNLRRAFRTIEALGRCVVWVDEIEKALQGATSGSADGGVSSDALGTFLTWMQERAGQSFVIATANDVSALPPELMRKGRFDEIFFVDLPSRVERAAIMATTLRQMKKGASVDLDAIAQATATFTGSEVTAIVSDAMFVAFSDNARDIETRDLVAAARDVVPLAKTAADKIGALRQWAKGKARNASTPEDTTQSSNVALDL